MISSDNSRLLEVNNRMLLYFIVNNDKIGARGR